MKGGKMIEFIRQKRKEMTDSASFLVSGAQWGLDENNHSGYYTLEAIFNNLNIGLIPENTLSKVTLNIVFFDKDYNVILQNDYDIVGGYNSITVPDNTASFEANIQNIKLNGTSVFIFIDVWR